jgi:osomolarity two-component system, response regulator SKN7
MIDRAKSRYSTDTTTSYLSSSISPLSQPQSERLSGDIASSFAIRIIIDSTPTPSNQATMDSQSMGANSANNSSDFVRKLYKMLEDPSYSSVVRWGDDGDSFVVLENEKFTKSILPKHFKHSNFASFVRQLNKYDFHKVRQNNEEGATSIYGPNAWEFRHPEFRANSKDSLDNIRRKAPAPRKPSQNTDEQMPIQQIDLMNQQLVAQAQQLEQLSGRYTELTINHQMMVQEVLRVQKTVLNHEHVIQDVMTFLHSVDAKQRRDSKAGVTFPPHSGEQMQPGSTLTPTSQNMPPPEDEPSSPLQHASKLLNDLHADLQFNMSSLEQLQENVHRAGFISTPPIDQNARGGAVQAPAPTSAGSSSTMGYRELDQIVYPMGPNNGIDPTYGEHVHNIPYSLPSKELDPSDPRRQYVDGRKRSTFSDPGWARAPRILLVEDDPTCRQIGSKFLYSFRCVVDTAVRLFPLSRLLLPITNMYQLDGLEAVNKMQEGVKYDMILMDIIMPNLDGVSACHIIRQFDRTPIVAMTSNIRSDDIQMYFQHGESNRLLSPSFMTDVEQEWTTSYPSHSHANHCSTCLKSI